MVLPYIDMNPPLVYMSSQSWTPLPPLSPYHLSGSSQCTSPKHPVSCIEHRLVISILHDSIHVSMPFSQIILLSPSPTESKTLFYASMSLLLSCIQGYYYHLSKFHIYVLYSFFKLTWLKWNIFSLMYKIISNRNICFILEILFSVALAYFFFFFFFNLSSVPN